jgi:hypothetical protein
MISDFVNSMWSLAQFHTVNIIIPQTPFTKGEFKVTPQQRLWGIEKLIKENTDMVKPSSIGDGTPRK